MIHLKTFAKLKIIHMEKWQRRDILFPAQKCNSLSNQPLPWRIVVRKKFKKGGSRCVFWTNKAWHFKMLKWRAWWDQGPVLWPGMCGPHQSHLASWDCPQPCQSPLGFPAARSRWAFWPARCRPSSACCRWPRGLGAAPWGCREDTAAAWSRATGRSVGRAQPVNHTNQKPKMQQSQREIHL